MRRVEEGCSTAVPLRTIDPLMTIVNIFVQAWIQVSYPLMVVLQGYLEEVSIDFGFGVDFHFL